MPRSGAYTIAGPGFIQSYHGTVPVPVPVPGTIFHMIIRCTYHYTTEAYMYVHDVDISIIVASVCLCVYTLPSGTKGPIQNIL